MCAGGGGTCRYVLGALAFGGATVAKISKGRRDLSSIDVCTVSTCGFDGASFEKMKRLRQSLDASDPEIVMYWSFIGEDKGEYLLKNWLSLSHTHTHTHTRHRFASL